ncbi:hypothetical protein B0H10DRAFT_2065038 [Mycena sp. CBHHK59/15]|nr:hypothetical protein B0H10DRAFT_2065038 [Mycena sp. CBHHK59/15]
MALTLPSHPPSLFPPMQPEVDLPWERSGMPPHRLPSFRSETTALDTGEQLRVPASKYVCRVSAASQVPCMSTLSSVMLKQATIAPLLSAAKHSRILASLLEQLSWHASWAFLCTCRDARDLFFKPELKDAILSRFVPGYSVCLRISDPLRLQNVPVALADLNFLLISQTVSLHRYPMHALACLSAWLPNAEKLERTSKFVTLTQAHSRFVLLLQALAHSSTLPPPPEPEEIEWKSSFEPNLRQLTFPAPLSYITPPLVPEPAPPVRHGRSRYSTDFGRAGKTPLATRSQSRPQSRLPLFRNSNPKIPPPPASEPRSLKHYTAGWRRPLSRASESTSDDEWGRKALERPHRRFASVNFSSDSSSFSNPSTPFSRDSTRELSSPPIRPGIFHHDLSLATSRTRAPILRVFVPCADLELSEDSDSIAQCENQLYESGLWDHLSSGDIVCNLGYVPPPEEPGSSDGSLPDSAGSEHALQNRRKWLLFNGESLVPFSPPESLPLRNPFILPSPCYYAHVMPPLTNPVFTVDRLPPCDDIPQMRLVSSSTKVRSPHSPTGFALVQKPVWTARVWRQVAQDDDIGLGWQGEWVLEGEGTREGQKVLLDCLRGTKSFFREWHLIREKSNEGRIWFRLIKTFSTN